MVQETVMKILLEEWAELQMTWSSCHLETMAVEAIVIARSEKAREDNAVTGVQKESWSHRGRAVRSCSMGGIQPLTESAAQNRDRTRKVILPL
jgi:hypothetical protein